MNVSKEAKAIKERKPSFDYSRLRSWYLATLRKRIIDKIESGAFTPSARISADRDAVYRLVAGASGPDQSAAVQLPQPADRGTSGLWRIMPLLYHLPVIIALLMLRETMVAGVYWTLLLVTILQALILSIAVNKRHEQWARQNKDYIKSRLDQAFSTESLGPRFEHSAELNTTLESTVKNLCDLLLQTSEREHAIADYALDFFCAIDSQGKILAASPSSTEYFGLTPGELQGMDFRDFVYGADQERTSRTLSALAKASGAIPFESRIKHGNGTIVDVAWHAEWSKQEAACFCIGKNVSNQRRLERTRQEFISMVGHDLKTPITAIDCTLELLADGDLNGQETLVANARGSIADLLKLINQLLELERMEDGKFPIEKEKTGLLSILNRSVGAVASYAQREGLEITVMPTDLSVNVDAEKVQQVIINLVGNAIKFSPSNSCIAITVEVKDGSEALVSITDSGPGIARAHQESIFERFQQISPDERHQGSGLGLSISRAIVQAHGGAIGVDSVEGKGSTFWFTLPLASR